MIKITAYKSEDGSLHENREDAYKADARYWKKKYEENPSPTQDTTPAIPKTAKEPRLTFPSDKKKTHPPGYVEALQYELPLPSAEPVVPGSPPDMPGDGGENHPDSSLGRKEG